MHSTTFSKTAIVFDEPHLEFGYEQILTDPRHGLALFGPFDQELVGRPSLGYIVIGSHQGVGRFHEWSVAVNNAATCAPSGNNVLWVPFPGFEAGFGRPFPSSSVWSYTIDENEMNVASRRGDPHERAFQVVDLYLDGIRRAHLLDEQIGVAICVVPDEVWRNCRPQSQVSDTTSRRIPSRTKLQLKAGQQQMFSTYDVDQFWYSTDFRRQLKARSMDYGIPLQLIRESTLALDETTGADGRDLTPLSDRMWNLSTALYYKCGGKPWRLVSARDGVCYIGISFRRSDEGQTACCAAQMFLNTGDGIVFRGEFGPWYSRDTKQFFLSGNAASALLDGVLRTYRDLEGKELTEIFLHKRSSISDEEFDGFQKACPDDVKLVGIRVRGVGRGGVRLYRQGTMPVSRGTFWRISRRSGLLWGTGFKREIGTYDGWETPSPMRIDIQHGNSQIERVAQDILGLTKLNYNACRIGDSLPVTIGFSDKVGEILISNPRAIAHKANFKYYI